MCQRKIKVGRPVVVVEKVRYQTHGLTADNWVERKLTLRYCKLHHMWCVHSNKEIFPVFFRLPLTSLRTEPGGKVRRGEERWGKVRKGESVTRKLWSERERGLAVARLDVKIMTSRLARLVVTWRVVIIYLLLQLHYYGATATVTSPHLTSLPAGPNTANQVSLQTSPFHFLRSVVRDFHLLFSCHSAHWPDSKFQWGKKIRHSPKLVFDCFLMLSRLSNDNCLYSHSDLFILYYRETRETQTHRTYLDGVTLSHYESLLICTTMIKLCCLFNPWRHSTITVISQSTPHQWRGRHVIRPIQVMS